MFGRLYTVSREEYSSHLYSLALGIFHSKYFIALIIFIQKTIKILIPFPNNKYQVKIQLIRQSRQQIRRMVPITQTNPL